MKNFLEKDPPVETDATLDEIFKWKKKDKNAQAIIGLTLSDDLLENVREVQTSKEMWLVIKNVFERHTLFYKLSARKKCYTATMGDNKSVPQFSNRIRQLAATL